MVQNVVSLVPVLLVRMIWRIFRKTSISGFVVLELILAHMLAVLRLTVPRLFCAFSTVHVRFP